MVAQMLQQNKKAEDAAERVAIMVEDNPDVSSVGFGGFPNRDGVVELDAAFMDSRTLSIGAVAGLTGYENPVSIARNIMHDMTHNLLVGSGALYVLMPTLYKPPRKLSNRHHVARLKQRHLS